MIPSTDYSYLGSGSMLIREYGAAAPFESVGNCSELSFTPQENALSLVDNTQPGGNLRNEVRRLTNVEMSYRFHDFSPANFSRGLRGDVTDVASGTATSESVVAYKGGYTPLAKIASAITTLEPVGGGTAYTEGTDYELRDGQLYIPSTSSITAPVAGAANIDVTYDYGAQKVLEALVDSAKDYEVMFIGLNEARSGKRVRVRAWKVSGGVLQEMALLGEDYGGGTVTGSLQSDSTKTGTGISQYLKVEFED